MSAQFTEKEKELRKWCVEKAMVIEGMKSGNTTMDQVLKSAREIEGYLKEAPGDWAGEVEK